MTPTIRSPGRVVLLAITAAIVALLMLPPATATAAPCTLTNADQDFITALEYRGITNTLGPCATAVVGRMIAYDIDSGIRTVQQEVVYVYGHTPASITMDDAAYMVGAAIEAYVPWDAYLIPRYGGGNPNAGLTSTSSLQSSEAGRAA
jgi:Protein of unknown function (DUF732)